MSITVKNESTGKISLPRPFVKTLVPNASVTVPNIDLSELEPNLRQKLTDMQNQGMILVTETDDVTQRGTFADASVADIHQNTIVGQVAAADGVVQNIDIVERPCLVQEYKCYFSGTVDTTESITLTLTRNGYNILNSAFAVTNGDTSPKAAVLLADDLNNTDGSTTAGANPDRLSAAGASFTTSHIGNLVLLNSGNANDGSYIIKSRISGTVVQLMNLNGSAPSFITATSQKWDMVLAVQAGDIIAVGATVANKSTVTQWAARLVLEPR